MVIHDELVRCVDALDHINVQGVDNCLIVASVAETLKQAAEQLEKEKTCGSTVTRTPAAKK